MGSTYTNNTTDYRYPIGKHAGKRISEIPSPYLVWAAREAHIEDWLRNAIESELDRRTESDARYQYQAPPTSKARIPQGVKLDIALQLVEAGRRNMAKTHHPDMGGNSQKMAEVNASADWLSEHLAEVLR